MLLQENIFQNLGTASDMIVFVCWLLVILLIIIIVLYPIKKLFDIRTSKRQGDRGNRNKKRRVK